MALPIEPVLGILSDNLRLRGSVMPLSDGKATAWARGLGLPRGGETVLYTGLMYQLMPATIRLGRMMADMAASDSWQLRWMGLGRKINAHLNIARLLARPEPTLEAAFNRHLAHIAKLLQRAGVAFGYLYEAELYAGALIHDAGVTDVFSAHARRVWHLLRSYNVRRIITVDPHTTHMLRHVYREMIPGYDMEVTSYLEVLAEARMTPARELEGQAVTLHDSCVYARYEDVIDQPRALLERAGVQLNEIDNSGKLTQCCGGPIESLFPSKAQALAEIRLKQMEAHGPCEVVSSCPICLVNLQQAATGHGTRVTDISEYLYRAYFEGFEGRSLAPLAEPNPLRPGSSR